MPIRLLLVFKAALIDLGRAAGEDDALIGIIDGQVAAEELYRYVAALIAKTHFTGSGHGRAGSGTAGKGLTVAALPYAHTQGRFIDDAHKFGVYPLGEHRSVLKFGTRFFKLEPVYRVAEHDAVRIAPREAGDILITPGDAQGVA